MFQSLDTGKMLSESEKYVGCPYVEHGRDIDGIDCYGLVVAIFKSCGISLPDPLNNEFELASLFETVNSPLPGDVFHFKGEDVDHVGVVLSKGDGPVFMVESTKGRGVIFLSKRKFLSVHKDYVISFHRFTG